MNKSNYKNHVGIDVSKSTLDYSILKNKELVGQGKLENNAKGLKKLKKHLKESEIAFSKVLICCEDTGIYNHQLLRWCEKENLPVWVESAVAVKKSLGLVRGKADKIDSHRIALYAARFEERCRLWQAPRTVIKQMKSLLSSRTSIIKLKGQLQQSLKEYKYVGDFGSYKLAQKYFRKIIEEQKTALKKIDKDLKELIKSDKKLSENVRIICSVEGAGIITAAMIIMHSKEFQGIKDPRKMACHAGIAPFPNTSGSSLKGKTKVSVFAHKELKSILHMASVSAAYGKGELAEYRKRMMKAGKHIMSILNAIKNKIIHRIYACIRDRRTYEKNYAKKF